MQTGEIRIRAGKLLMPSHANGATCDRAQSLSWQKDEGRRTGFIGVQLPSGPFSIPLFHRAKLQPRQLTLRITGPQSSSNHQPQLNSVQFSFSTNLGKNVVAIPLNSLV